MALTTQTFTGSVAVPTPVVRVPVFDLHDFAPPIGFHIHPQWASVQGSGISLSCQKALLDFPMVGRITSKYTPSFVVDKHCVLGLYVTHPDRWKPTKVYTTYQNLQDWVSTAILMNCGTYPGGAGWSLDLAGGAQVCYFEGAYIDPQFKCASPKWFKENPEATLADCLDSNIPAWPKPVVEPSAPVTAIVKDVLIGRPRLMPEWVIGEQIPYQDCMRMLTGEHSAFTHLAWFGERGGITFALPWIWTNGRCRGGLFLTSPAPTLGGLRPKPLGINFQHEAFILAEHTVKSLKGGGLMDMANGWQFVLYDKDIDPKDLCSKIRSKSLRRCLDDLIRLRKITEVRNTPKQTPGSGASSSKDHRPGTPSL